MDSCSLRVVHEQGSDPSDGGLDGEEVLHAAGGVGFGGSCGCGGEDCVGLAGCWSVVSGGCGGSSGGGGGGR